MTEWKIDWNRIKKECPKTYELFKEKYNNKPIITGYSDLFFGINECNKEISFVIGDGNSDIEEDYPFEMVYGLIESFFDSLGIIIIIDFLHTSEIFYYDIYKDDIPCFSSLAYDEEYGYYNSRTEAKIAATYKAFEIAEAMEDKK